MSILIVEDELVSKKILESILKKNNFEVVGKSSGLEALEFLAKNEPCELIITDAMMPIMDGFTLINKIKKDKRYQNIPTILCSSLNDKTSIVKGIEAGIVDYIVKPVTEAILIPKIKEIFSKRPGGILVVDDKGVIRSVLERILKREGYTVLLTESGKGALELIQKEKISVIVSDVGISDMSGLELSSQVKEINSNIRVILTSERGEFTREQVISAGADDLLSRPFHNTEVIIRIRALYK